MAHMETSIGNFYMATALRYGKTEIVPGVMLYSATGIDAENWRDKAGNPFTHDSEYYFVLTACDGPENITGYLAERELGVYIPYRERG